MCTIAPLFKSQALWYLRAFVVFVVDAMLINGQTKVAAPKYFSSFLFSFRMLSSSVESWLIEAWSVVSWCLNLAGRFSGCFFQQLSSSCPSFSQNVHLVRSLSPFLRPLFALDAASALTSAAIVMRDSSRSSAVRSSIVGRSSSLALLWMVERLANAHWLYVSSTPSRKAASWRSFGRGAPLSWSFCNVDLKLSWYSSTEGYLFSLVVIRWMNKLCRKVKPFSLYWLCR